MDHGDALKLINGADVKSDSAKIAADPLYQIRPFAALLPSLRPSSQCSSHRIAGQHFDEFGFKIDSTTSAARQAFVESTANRRAWLTCLEFSHTHTLGVSNLDDYDGQYTMSGSTVDDEEDELWSRVHTRLSPSVRLAQLIRGQSLDVLAQLHPGEQSGIPHSLRPHIWPRLTGSLEKARNAKLQDPPITYAELVQLSSSDDLVPGLQIEKDLLRTLPNNYCFSSSQSTGISRLRRILRALAWYYVDVGYCQGMGMIAANLLLCLEEETAFWMLCAIVEDLLPPSYYSSSSLLGVQADQAVLAHLLQLYLPELDQLLREHDIEIPLITLQWFLTLFSSVCPTATTLRIWDLFFYDHSAVLFRMALAMLSYKETELLRMETSAQLFNGLASIPNSITDINELILIAYSFDDEHLDASNLSSLRRHYLAQLLVGESAFLPSSPKSILPKQYLTKRDLGRPRNIFGTFMRTKSFSESRQPRRTQSPRFSVPFRNTTQYPISVLSSPISLSSNASVDDSLTDLKLKNVRQTELLLELKHAILTIVRHFRVTDPQQHASAKSQADYSLESHSLDLDNYVQIIQHRPRRAKAMIDFEAQDTDELGFKKNAIITILNTDDEHCWFGRSDDAQGWFPAKFVELLDERGKNYSPAGDDAVDRNIASLARGILSSALRSIFVHGLKRSRLLLGESASHPWHFIEEAAAREVERDFSSVYSRLVLCKAFGLDKEGKVLSPEELLYRAIHNINISHDLTHTHMDVKFRSLVCLGLNEQLLHMWLETLCSSEKVIEKWYHPWSYMRSPGWVQIKCELRVLSQFAFHLSPVYELIPTTSSNGVHKSITSSIPSNYLNNFRRFKLSLLPARTKNQALQRLTSAASTSDPINDRPALNFLSTVPHDAGPKSSISTNETGDMLVKYHLFSWEL